jgi:hypothetical protein
MLRGIDLGVEWRERRWRRLLALVERLPADSHLAEAMATDEELAAELSDGEQPRQATPRISEWSAVRSDLAALYDRMGTVYQAIVASAGKKPPRLQPYPRPVTAGQRAQSRGRAERHKARVARFSALPRYGSTRDGGGDSG